MWVNLLYTHYFITHPFNTYRPSNALKKYIVSLKGALVQTYLLFFINITRFIFIVFSLSVASLALEQRNVCTKSTKDPKVIPFTEL